MQKAIPKLMVFDLYGTLIKFGIMHHPFRELLKWARENGRQVDNNDARTLMTVNADLTGLATHLGIKAPEKLLNDLQERIDDELSSLTLFEDVVPVLSRLQELNVPTAICSNLAQPYGAAIKRLLSQFPLRTFLSYEIGYIKPDAQIYERIITSAQIPESSCLFVGDSYIADYDGPLKNGFQARHLIRGQKSDGYIIGSLSDVISVFDNPM